MLLELQTFVLWNAVVYLLKMFTNFNNCVFISVRGNLAATSSHVNTSSSTARVPEEKGIDESEFSFHFHNSIFVISKPYSRFHKGSNIYIAFGSCDTFENCI